MAVVWETVSKRVVRHLQCRLPVVYRSFVRIRLPKARENLQLESIDIPGNLFRKRNKPPPDLHCNRTL